MRRCSVAYHLLGKHRLGGGQWVATVKRNTAMPCHSRIVSERHSSYQLDEARQELLRRLFDSVPESAEERSQVLAGLRWEFHNLLAKSLEPVIREHVRRCDSTSYVERQQVASWVDRFTRELGVTTADPETGKPGLLVVERSLLPGEGRTGYYTLRIKTGRHGSQIGERLVHQDLSNVPLIPAPPDIDSMFADYRPRVPSRRSK